MLLHLMRHGIAVPADLWTGSDSERPLTDRGSSELRDLARGLEVLDVSFDLVVSSPYRRALDTAQIVAQVLRVEAAVEECPALCPGARLENVVRFLEPFAGSTSMLLVGHMPDIASMALALVGCGDSGGLLFGQGAICSIELDGLPPQRRGRLGWLLPPAHLLALAAPAERG